MSKLNLLIATCCAAFLSGLAPNAHSDSIELHIGETSGKNSIKLYWQNNHPDHFTFLEYSRNLNTWSNIAVHAAARDETETFFETSISERAFYRLKIATRENMLGSSRHQWLHDPPDPQPSFRKLDYALSDWDDLTRNHTINADGSPWITKQSIGPASVGPYEIIRYDFLPENPQKTIIATGSIHGIEWPSTDILFRIFRMIDEKHNEIPILGYLRNNVHFIVIPILNPWGYVYQDRRCRETAPIPVFWERNGNRVTIEIDAENFPDSDGRFAPQNYITDQSAGKLVVSLQAASDASTLPVRGYKVESVIDNLRFTVLSEDTGNTNGTAEFFVLTDMNRQFDINNWEGFSHLTWTDANGVPYANKGTRPYALAETQYLKDLLHTYSNAVAYLDFHTGPPYPYCAYYGANDNFDREPIDAILAFLAPPSDEVLIGENVLPSGNSYAAQLLGMQSFTPETGGTDAAKTLRWWLNILIAYSLLY